MLNRGIIVNLQQCKLELKSDKTFFILKFFMCFENVSFLRELQSWTKILAKAQKSSKIRQDQKILITDFA